MKLARREPRPAQETIVALIDVVFFLLVFFMLIGRMDATSPFQVDPAIAQTGADVPIGGTTVAIGNDGQLALDGTRYTRGDLLLRVGVILVQDFDHLVRINAHQDTELRYVLPLVAQIENTGARNIVFVVTPERR